MASRIPAAAAQKFVVPGSNMTAGDVARQRAQAVQVRYGGQEQQLGSDIAGQRQLGADQQQWYAQYLAELRQHQANVSNAAAAQGTAQQQLLGSIRGLDQGNLSAQSQQMQADAANRGATVGAQVGQDASNASATRQSMLAAYATQLGNQGRAASNYADTQAHVVGPGQQLEAQTQSARNVQAAQQKMTDLKALEGAYGQQYADQLIAAEQKNVLAREALGLNVQKAQNQVSIAQGHDTTSRANTTDQIAARQQAASQRQAAKGQQAAAQGEAKRLQGVRQTSAKVTAGVQTALDSINTYRNAAKSKPTSEQLAVLLHDDKLNPTFVQAALEIDKQGHISDQSIQALHRMGARIPRAWLPDYATSPAGYTTGQGPGANRPT